ncbi:MAG: FliM/FliN family flagellar motor C-terminal domain-containing protein [Pirellulales bacterium]|nr:FliM/FliN family flagellar motor C-terminal domain-containing protein [Pirellulales bacterium]
MSEQTPKIAADALSRPLDGEAIPHDSAPPPSEAPLSFSALPGYSRSLLKINLPVKVVLAEKKERLGEITELAPGAIIKFDKACDALLQMCVGNLSVAEGEAVKVGDKFGFRVSRILMPKEHFTKVQSRHAG